MRPGTEQRIRQAMDELSRQRLEATRAGRRLVIDLVMEAPARFTASVQKALEAALPALLPAAFRVRAHLFETAEPGALAAMLGRIGRRGSHGVLLKAPGHPALRDAVGALAAARVPVVTLVTLVTDLKAFAYEESKTRWRSQDEPMHIDLLPGTTNVVRFPVERRVSPTLDLLRGIAPDSREMMALAESFGLPQPDPRARHDEDEGTAEFIANHVVPEPGPARRKALDEMLAEALGAAVAACQAAHDASVVADKARQVLIDAQTAGGHWLPPLEQRTDDRTVAAATLLLEAHELSERAEGAARAIGFARRGETWRPFDLQAEAAALFGRTG